MTDFRIRLAGPEDEAAIAAVIEAAYAPWRERLPDMPDLTSGLAEELSEGPAWVAVTGARITGVLLATIQDEGLSILNLAVDPQVAGRGQGGALLEVAETFARTGGAHEMRLTTHRDMSPTLAFYKGRRWREIDREGIKVYMTLDLSRD